MNKRMMRRGNLSVALILSTVLLGGGGSSWAGGILTSESGSQAMQRAGAFIAKSDDPTALLHNPAGLAKAARKLEFYIGTNFLDYSLSYDRSGTYPTPAINAPAYAGDEFPVVDNTAGGQILPYLGASQKFGKLALAEGLYGPSSNPKRAFSNEVGGGDVAPAPQRYDLYNQEALIVMPSVGAAYRIKDNLDVGVRLSWGLSQIKASSGVWGVPNDDESPDLDSRFDLDVKDNFIPAFGLGVLFRPTSAFEVGVTYHSAVSVRAKGTAQAILGANLAQPIPNFNAVVEPVPDDTATCARGGTIDALKTCLALDLPQMIGIGGRWILRDNVGKEKADIELDVRWENWSSASDVVINVDGRTVLRMDGDPTPTTFLPALKESVIRHGFKDVLSVRLGGSYKLPMGKNTLEFRLGLAHDTAAAPKSWTRLDLDGKARTTFAGGLAFEFGSFRIDAGAGYIMQPTVTVTDATPVPVAQDDRVQPDPIQPLNEPNDQDPHPFNAGTYTSHYLVFGGGLTAWF